MADFDPASVRVMNLPETQRSQYLTALKNYSLGRQWDHLDLDWSGRKRDPWAPHAIERLRAVGVYAVDASAAPTGTKRPNAPVPLAGLVVEGFSDILLGEGREPTVQVLGDQNTESLLEAIFKTSETWDALAEARDDAGACGSSAFLPLLEDGQPSAQVLDTATLSVLEWEKRSAWIPRVVIEQKLVEIPVPDDDGIPQMRPAWRTRAWDHEYEYVYEDLLLDDRELKGETTEERHSRRLQIGKELKLAETIKHHAGRCPVVWIQNVRDSECPDSTPDYDQQSMELMDRADVLQSMIVRGTIANVDPTLHVRDYVWAQRFWAQREKGFGKVIKTSEAGDAKLIEINGASITTARDTLRDLILQIEHRCGIVIIDPDTAGSYRSGEALSLLWRRMEQKAGRKRRALTRAVRQVAKIWLSILQSIGVRNVDVPPRVLPSPDGSEPELTDQELGEGRWLKIDWPPYNYPTPAQLLQTAQALSLATGNKQFLSEETSTSWMLGTMGKTDPQRERQQIKAEQRQRVDELDAELGAGLEDGDEEALITVDEAADRDGDDSAASAAAGDGQPVKGEGSPGVGDASTVQETALNGAQVTSLVGLVERAGDTLAPGAARLLIPKAFSVIPQELADTMVEEQLRFLEARRQQGAEQQQAVDQANRDREAEARARELANESGVETDDEPDEFETDEDDEG
ncbi:MAG: phage portal protein [Pigmentiphaga sp.]|nr:phage portal protein [Pigmentiphaga sp.]